MQRKIVGLLILIFSELVSSNSVTIKNTCTENCNNYLFIYGSYGNDQNSCVKTFINDTSNNFSHNYSMHFDLSKINSRKNYDKINDIIIERLNQMQFDIVFFYDFYINDELNKYLQTKSGIKIVSTGKDDGNKVKLVYDFNRLFKFINKLKLHQSEEVYYISNFFVYSDYDILTELKNIPDIKIIDYKIKTLADLKSLLIKLNKSESAHILIFNLYYLISETNGKIVNKSDIIRTINTYNISNIPVNINNICKSDDQLPLNLVFNVTLNDLLTVDNKLIIRSNLIINLFGMYKLNLLQNTENEDLTTIFELVHQVY